MQANRQREGADESRSAELFEARVAGDQLLLAVAGEDHRHLLVITCSTGASDDAVAERLGVTPAAVSSLKRRLYTSWCRFTRTPTAYRKLPLSAQLSA